MNMHIKFRQPIYVGGKFDRWHYWGFVEDIFVAPMGWSISPGQAEKSSQQYLPLNDDNNNQMCEGDIVKIRNPKSQLQKLEIVGVIAESGYGAWGITKLKIIKRTGYSHKMNQSEIDMMFFLNIIGVKHIERIGNVIENPELLTVSNVIECPNDKGAKHEHRI